jgi:hypothetical protein
MSNKKEEKRSCPEPAGQSLSYTKFSVKTEKACQQLEKSAGNEGRGKRIHMPESCPTLLLGVSSDILQRALAPILGQVGTGDVPRDVR